MKAALLSGSLPPASAASYLCALEGGLCVNQKPLNRGHGSFENNVQRMVDVNSLKAQ